MAYEVVISPPACRDLETIKDGPLRQRLLIKSKELESFPELSGLKKLVGGDTLWRRRVGDWRITFEVIKRRGHILILHIRQRKDTYR
jgi:mRNA-degrading endonuclease RelE of RelBE toxin-antitoxin system